MNALGYCYYCGKARTALRLGFNTITGEPIEIGQCLTSHCLKLQAQAEDHRD